MNDSLWGHKNMQLSLPTTESLNHSRKRRQHEGRRLGEAVRQWLLPFLFCSKPFHLWHLQGLRRLWPLKEEGARWTPWSGEALDPLLQAGVEDAPRPGPMVQRAEWWPQPRQEEEIGAVASAPSKTLAFPALGGSYQSNDNTAVQRLLKQNPPIS